MTAPSAKDHEQQLIDYLIGAGEAVEYGEPWTARTTYEWWINTAGERHCRLVQTYHGGGSRGDDDQAEYARRLLDMGRAVLFGRTPLEPIEKLTEEEVAFLCENNAPEITHAIVGEGEQARALRFRRYNPPPEGL